MDGVVNILTAVDNSLISEFRRPISSTINLMIVSSDIVRLVRAAQCKTFATFSTASVSWKGVKKKKKKMFAWVEDRLLTRSFTISEHLNVQTLNEASPHKDSYQEWCCRRPFLQRFRCPCGGPDSCKQISHTCTFKGHYNTLFYNRNKHTDVGCSKWDWCTAKSCIKRL